MSDETEMPGRKHGRATGPRASALASGLVFAFAMEGAIAQTTPYQSQDRSDYGSGPGQGELPSGARFEPRVEATVQYAANINLAEDGEQQVDTGGLEVAPGFYASYSSGTALAAIDYTLIGRWWEEDEYNDVSHRLDANGEWYVVPEWLSLAGQATYGNTILDPAAGSNYGGIGVFGPGNLAEVATASASPVLKHQFGDVQILGQYQYGRTWYLDEGLGLDEPVVGFSSGQDSTDQSAHASIGTAADAGRKVSGSLFYDWQESEYDASLPYRYERAGVDFGVHFARTLTLLGEYGRESDLDASTTQGGLDSEYWNAGLRWDPSERTSAEGRYGERFFGDSWSLDVTHRTRTVEFNAAYSEEPTVETRTLSLGEFDPGTLPPGVPPEVGFGRLSSSPYVARNASAGVSAVGSRTKLSLIGYRIERDYISDVRRDENSLGVVLGVTRRLATNLSADFNVSYSDYERMTSDLVEEDELTSNDKDTTVVLRLNRESGAKFTLSAEAGYLTRSGSEDYDGWWTALRARWTP